MVPRGKKGHILAEGREVLDGTAAGPTCRRRSAVGCFGNRLEEEQEGHPRIWAGGKQRVKAG